jgi:isopenicillin N synthase-like dioxygenase
VEGRRDAEGTGVFEALGSFSGQFNSFVFFVLMQCNSYHLQWPDDTLIPGFRKTFEEYLAQVQRLSYDFSSLLAEAFGLPSNALKKFYDTDPNMQHRSKIVRYPVISEGESEAQGVGPHYDAGFLTFVSCVHVFLLRRYILIVLIQLLQASPHHGLQVQNLSGQWIDAPPIDGTFVVNIGKGS